MPPTIDQRSCRRTSVIARIDATDLVGRFERTDYRFELVTDYGAFRDLQRHRVLTIEWQPLTADLGFDVPEVIQEAGLAERYEESLLRSADLYYDMREELPEQAQYCVALAFRIRYVMQMKPARRCTSLNFAPVPRVTQLPSSGPGDGSAHPRRRWARRHCRRHEIR